jgi:HlyD family secretion protein
VRIVSSHTRLLAVAAAMCTLTECAARPATSPSRVSGHVEATDVQVAAEVSGRLIELRVDEGDRVNAGDVVARLDTRDTELLIRRARAERAVAVAQLRLLRAGPRVEDVRQAEAQVVAARAEVGTIAAEIRAAEIDLDRFEALLRASAGSEKQRDDAKARVDVARERQQSAEQRVEVAERAAARARSGARPEEVETAVARVASIDAQVASLEKSLDDAVVIAPAAGVVTQKLVEAGELVTRGAPLVIVTDLEHAWANLFVPEPMAVRLKLGQTATVLTDAGGAGRPGTVTFISPRAEFTPRNVQTTEERSKLVFRIKVSVDNRDQLLKPGMPVDADLDLP